MLRSKQKPPPDNVVERWEIVWDHGRTIYGSFPYHRTYVAALREALKLGNKKDDYGHRLENVTIKRVMVAS